MRGCHAQSRDRFRRGHRTTALGARSPSRGAGGGRTPGVRREEVAALADVSVTWYTFLEQGRPIRMSGDALGRVAGALRLSPQEERHLFLLADRAPPAPQAASNDIGVPEA